LRYMKHRCSWCLLNLWVGKPVCYQGLRESNDKNENKQEKADA
jgi:hypothetical protein